MSFTLYAYISWNLSDNIVVNNILSKPELKLNILRVIQLLVEKIGF